MLGALETLPDTPPGKDLWAGIHRGLESRDSRATFSLFRLAAASVVFVMVAIAVLFAIRDTSKTELDEGPAIATYREAIRDVEQVLNEVKTKEDPLSFRT